MPKSIKDQIDEADALNKGFAACNTDEEKRAFVEANPRYLLNKLKAEVVLGLLMREIDPMTLVGFVDVMDLFSQRLEKLETLFRGPCQ